VTSDAPLGALETVTRAPPVPLPRAKYDAVKREKVAVAEGEAAPDHGEPMAESKPLVGVAREARGDW